MESFNKTVQLEIKQYGFDKRQEMAENWFKLNKDKSKSTDLSFVENNKMQPGKLHIFNYNALHAKTLDYWDKTPIVLFIGQRKIGRKIFEIGVNLNFAPIPFKFYIISEFIKQNSHFFNNENKLSALDQNINIIDYKSFKETMKRFGLGFCIRMYIPKRKTKLYVVNYNNWVDAAFLSNSPNYQKFEKIKYSGVVSEFKKYLATL